MLLVRSSCEHILVPTIQTLQSTSYEQSVIDLWDTGLSFKLKGLPYFLFFWQ